VAQFLQSGIVTPRGKLRFRAAAKSRKFWPRSQKMLLAQIFAKMPKMAQKTKIVLQITAIFKYVTYFEICLNVF
jgi:hypothetical protein